MWLNCQLLFGWGGGRRGWLPPSATAPPNAHFNPQLPIAVIVVHRNFSAILPSFVPPLPPLPIAIVPPAGRCHHCIPLQSWPAAPACCHTAARCCRHAASAAHCRTHAGCLPSIAIISLRYLCHWWIFYKILSLCCWLRHPISEVPHALSRHYLAEPFPPKVLLTYAFSCL